MSCTHVTVAALKQYNLLNDLVNNIMEENEHFHDSFFFELFNMLFKFSATIDTLLKSSPITCNNFCEEERNKILENIQKLEDKIQLYCATHPDHKIE